MQWPAAPSRPPATFACAREEIQRRADVGVEVGHRGPLGVGQAPLRVLGVEGEHRARRLDAVIDLRRGHHEAVAR